MANKVNKILLFWIETNKFIIVFQFYNFKFKIIRKINRQKHVVEETISGGL